MDDLELTFNEMAFIKSIDNINKALTGMSNTALGVSKKLSDKFGNFSEKRKKDTKEQKKEDTSYFNSTSNLIGGLTKRVLGLGAAYLGIRQIMRYLPEIGKTFSIAGDIVMRNLLWPLRRELIPLLQKLLDWVRDHREMFVRWGQVIANVFRMVKGWVMIVINTFKTMYNAFMKAWEGFFGKSKKSIFEWINVFIFHLTVIMIGLQTLLMPVFEKIGKLFGQIAVLAHGFITGLAQGLGQIMSPLDDLVDLLKDIFDTFDLGSEDLKGLYDAFVIFGDFLGTTFVAAIQFVVSTLRVLWTTIKGLGQGIKGIVEVLTGDLAGAKETFKSMVETFKTGYSKGAEGYKKIGTRYKEFGERSLERIAPQSIPVNRTSNYNNEVKIDKIELKVENEDQGKKVGKDFVKGMQEQYGENMKRQVLKEKALTGY